MNRSRLAFVVGNGRARSVDAHRLRWRQLLPERPEQHQPAGARVKLATGRALYVFDLRLRQGHGQPPEVALRRRLCGHAAAGAGRYAAVPVAQDSKAGNVKGQGVGGIWWVVGPDGKEITTQYSDSGNNGY